ncbi:MAG: AarF/ABC1/UbiB kinase family protein [Polyangiaceae bacterium]|nr:AarF/ABC1/UbiB kinase family protein [Myxococcales bacterium]MCB9585625.1 AarF/ABC1/UbiB kinase family protein [Polyangiaceae bacterium]MCB9606360.1 AarF/ABC1/UbiB kinase family protein [Polyangiaceae bacterium]
MKEVKIDALARGFKDRTLVTARMASKLGVRYVKRSLGAGGPAAATPKQLEVARKLVRDMSSMKGLIMKFGQMASYMPGALPPDAQRILAELQAESTALKFERVKELVETEFGCALDEAFDDFEREPFAAASIGQVHRASHAGQAVAVKVQYPEIEEALKSDLKTVGFATTLSTLGMPIDGRALLSELAERLMEECDYQNEAENQRFFSRLLAGYTNVHVPEVVAERTTTRVLTTHLVDGQRFYPFCDSAPQELKDRAAEAIFRVSFDCIFRHATYNADPHPGNYLFGSDGQVTFLDYGCVRRFDPHMIAAWKRVALSVLDDRRADFERYFPDLGMVPKPKRFDWDHQWAVMRYLYTPFMQRAPHFTYTHEYVQQSYALLLFDNPNKLKTAMPPEWLFLNRLQWGLNSVLAYLDATGPWPDIWRAAVESPTPGA